MESRENKNIKQNETEDQFQTNNLNQQENTVLLEYPSTDHSEQNNQVQIQQDSVLATENIQLATQNNDTTNIISNEVETITELSNTETLDTIIAKQTNPVVKYVQDTIYEIDSTRISRWNFRKIK